MTTSLFAGLKAAPADPILGVSEKFRADPRAEKVNLGVGAYLTEEGRTPILEVVQEAEEAIVAARIPHTYIPISGLAGYGELVQKMVFGAASEIVLSGRAATVQTLGAWTSCITSAALRWAPRANPPGATTMRFLRWPVTK